MPNEISTKLSPDAGQIAVGKHGLSMRSLQDQVEYARILLKSGFCPRSYQTPQQVVAAINYGQELGFSPIQALQGIAIINNRPTMWGDSVKALVLKSDLCLWVTESIEGEGDAMTAVCRTQRKGWPEVSEARFSWKDATLAGLTTKGPWVSYPKRMLQMRARSWCLRDTYADLLCGLQVREEVTDYGAAPDTGRVRESLIETELMGEAEPHPYDLMPEERDEVKAN